MKKYCETCNRETEHRPGYIPTLKDDGQIEMKVVIFCCECNSYNEFKTTNEIEE